jgi:type I restriction enzyme, S subunit
MSLPKYPQYKDSGVEWLGEVPAHWTVQRLKASITSCKNGVWGDDPKGDADDIECVRVADFDRSRLVVDGEVPTLRSVRQSERIGRTLLKGDLLLEKSGGGEKQPVGQVVLYDRDSPAVCSNFVAKVTLAERMVPRFWMYKHAAAYSRGVNIGSIKQTSGIQNLDQAQYFNERGIFPPEDDQTRIADFLDREAAKIDALIAEQEKLLALLAEKRQATISHAVTRGLDPNARMKNSGVSWLGEVPAHWHVRSVSSLSTKITNGYVGPTRDVLVDEGVRYLQSLHIKRNTIRFDQPYYVRQEWSDDHAKSILEAGDVLIVQTGDIGQSAVVTEEFAGCNCHALIIVAPVREELDGRWLSWVLNSDYGFNSLLSIQTGALHPHLNCGNVKGIYVPLPPLAEQKQIVEYIEGVTRRYQELTEAAEKAVELYRERRSALIAAAVTGKIDVSNAVQRGAQAP